MERTVSVRATARKMSSDDRKLRARAERAATADGAPEVGPARFWSAVTSDSFVNFAQRMGVGADNPMSTAGYGFNPVTRIRTTLEWVHRGSWLGGVAIDMIADDMTRKGVEHLGKLKPEDQRKIDVCAKRCGVWDRINENYQWSRLYGGSIAVVMIEGQKMETPFDPAKVARGGFKGLVVLDRWMVEPSLDDLVTEPGPDVGLPKFYAARTDAPALRGQRIHHSRCMRLVGIRLPHWQAVMENLWGISVFERLWDRMTAFDSGTTGMAQLLYKAWIRTYKIEGLRNIIAAGGKPLDALLKQIDLMRRTQNSEGVTLMDLKDEFETFQNVPFAGIREAVLHLAEQLSGALQIPLVRLFGQSPGGLNSPGDHEMRMYHENINKEQNKSIGPVEMIYRAMARSEGVTLPDDWELAFKPLWELSEKEKAEIAETDGRAIGAAEEQGLISQKTAMTELKKSARVTGRFASITDEDIEAAEESLPPAGAEAASLELEQSKELESHKAGEVRKTAKVAPKPKTGDDAVSAPAAMLAHHGVHVVIENPRGSIRTGGANGHGWQAILAADYGYVRATLGEDGDPVDCFVGPNPASGVAFVLHQINPRDGTFDEHKCLLGFRDRASAMAAYLGSYSDDAGPRIGWVAEMPMADFKSWLARNPDRRGAPPVPVSPTVDAAAEERGVLKAVLGHAHRAMDAVMAMAGRPAPAHNISVAPPAVTVNLPESKVNFTAGDVKVDVAPAPPAAVTVNPPDVTVNVRAYPRSTTDKIARDDKGEAHTITRKNED